MMFVRRCYRNKVPRYSSFKNGFVSLPRENSKAIIVNNNEIRLISCSTSSNKYFFPNEQRNRPKEYRSYNDSPAIAPAIHQQQPPEQQRQDPSPMSKVVVENKTWRNEGLPIKERVTNFIESDFTIKNDGNKNNIMYVHDDNIIDLIKSCALLQSLPGMQLAHDVLDRLLVLKRSSMNKVLIDTELFRTAMFGWAKFAANDPQSAVIARNRMKELMELIVNEAISDTTRLSRVEQPEQLRRKSDGSLCSSIPDMDLYNTYIYGLSNVSKYISGAAMDADVLLFEMTSYYDMMNWPTKPNRRSYALILQGYSNAAKISPVANAGPSNNKDVRKKKSDTTTKSIASAGRAIQLLQQIHEMFSFQKEKYFERYNVPYKALSPSLNERVILTPDSRMYNIVMNAIINAAHVSKSNNSTIASSNFADTLFALLQQATILSSSAGGTIASVSSLSLLSSSLLTKSKSDSSNSSNSYTNSLNKGNEDKFDMIDESLLVEAIKGSNNGGNEKNRLKHLRILDEGLLVTAIHGIAVCNSVERNARTRLRNAVAAEKIFNALNMSAQNSSNNNNKDDDDSADDYSESNPVSARAANAAIESELNSNTILVGFNSCLDAWAKSHLRESAIRCEKLLLRFLDATVAKGNTHTDNKTTTTTAEDAPIPQPNAVSFGTDKGESYDFSDGSAELKPNAVSFNTCIYAWSKSYSFFDNAAEKAENLLRLQLDLCRSGFLDEKAKPDFQTYSLVILSYTNSIGHKGKSTYDYQQLLHCRRLLDELMNSVQCNEIDVTRNPAAPFSAVISAASRCRPARQLIDQHGSDVPSSKDFIDDKTLYANEYENESDFNLVVNEQSDPYFIAMKTYVEVKNDVYNIGASPDHHTYIALLRCIASHCPPQSAERGRATKQIFDDACQLGQLSKLVVEKIIALVDDPAALDIGITDPTTIPNFCKRNVPAGYL